MKVLINLVRYGGVILNSDLKMKEMILQFINKLNLVQRILLFLLIINIFLGPIILHDLRLISIFNASNDIYWGWFFSFEDNYFYFALSLVLICGMLIFKKGN